MKRVSLFVLFRPIKVSSCSHYLNSFALIQGLYHTLLNPIQTNRKKITGMFFLILICEFSPYSYLVVGVDSGPKLVSCGNSAFYVYLRTENLKLVAA